jgi:hypothetical protein
MRLNRKNKIDIKNNELINYLPGSDKKDFGGFILKCFIRKKALKKQKY